MNQEFYLGHLSLKYLLHHHVTMSVYFRQEAKEEIKGQVSPASQPGGRKERQTWQGRATEHKDIPRESLFFDNSGRRENSKVNILDPIFLQLSDNFHYQHQVYILK